MRSCTAALLLLILPGTALAQNASATPGPDAPIRLAFSAYAAGLNVVKMTADVEFTPQGYRVGVDYHTAGVFGAFMSNRMDTTATGTWMRDGVAPIRFYSVGHLRGRARQTLIDYINGQPDVRALDPPDDDREPVPPDLARNTIDTVSALALLVRTVERTGRCDGHADTFDGRRSSVISVHDAGIVDLPRDSDSVFSGPARRCDFEGRQTGGFVKDADREELTRVQHGSAWLAQLFPGRPPMPVRMSFHTRFFGNATMYLTAAKVGGDPYPQ